MSRFKVDHVLRLRDRGVFILAYHVDAHEFSVSSSSTLAGAPLREYLDQPRKLKPNGEIDSSYFAFHLANPGDGALFSVGDLVSLEP